MFTSTNFDTVSSIHFMNKKLISTWMQPTLIRSDQWATTRTDVSQPPLTKAYQDFHLGDRACGWWSDCLPLPLLVCLDSNLLALLMCYTISRYNYSLWYSTLKCCEGCKWSDSEVPTTMWLILANASSKTVFKTPTWLKYGVLCGELVLAFGRTGTRLVGNSSVHIMGI